MSKILLSVVALFAFVFAGEASAQTVTHYQISKSMSGGQCAGDGCTMRFAGVPAGNVLDLTHVACSYSQDNAGYGGGFLNVLAASTVKLQVPLAPSYASGGGSFWVAQPISVRVPAGQHVEIVITSGGPHDGSPALSCSLSGMNTNSNL